MGKAAVPKYLTENDDNFNGASPGMRFGMYLKVWNSPGGREKAWIKDKNANRSALGAAAELGEHKKLMEALVSRQEEMAQNLTSTLRVDAVSVAPFTTGLGNEHPLENGFAFLWPYGLPYMHGSGVKGVLRQAAQELRDGIWDEPHGWNREKTYPLKFGGETIDLNILDVLFGRGSKEGEREHVCGVFTFWDVYPCVKAGKLLVEILTPHYTHYYQQTSGASANEVVSPHDSGQPTPNLFLTVPPKSRFHFVVVCDTARLWRLAPDLLEHRPDGQPEWQALILSAFRHAFTWLGFGAKTAVGYGAMRMEGDESRSDGSVQQDATQPARVADSQTETWENATLEYRPNTGEIFAHCDHREAMCPSDMMREKIFEKLGAEKAERLKKRRTLPGMKVHVLRKGNMIELVDLCD